MTASQGTTDFGQYFIYFSFFLVVAALLLAYLFFAVGLEQRTQEIGLLAAVGYAPRAIRRAFLTEGAVLAAIGALIGAGADVGYGALIMYGLRTWWVGAVGTTNLELHVAPGWLAAGMAGACSGFSSLPPEHVVGLKLIDLDAVRRLAGALVAARLEREAGRSAA